MKNRTLALAMAMLMIVSLVSGLTVSAADQAVKIVMNGTAIETDVDAYVNEDGRTMVPVRFVAEEMNASVSWDEEAQTVTVERSGTTFVLTIGSAEYTLNGEVMEMDTEAVIVDSRTMVPVRFVSEGLGENVEWDESTYTVSITPPTGTEMAVVSGLDEDGNDITGMIDIYTWDSLPIEVERQEIQEFTLPTGEVHQYEVVYYGEMGINWVQAKALAEQAGGYLATATSEEENEFIFSLVEDEQYWFKWDETHFYVMSGVFLGGYQPYGSEEPDNNWKWITGEAFDYTNWCIDGVEEDEDPRPNTQPNDATGNQNVLCFGELNYPVSYWGDFPHKFGSLGSTADGQAYGFVIEYGDY